MMLFELSVIPMWMMKRFDIVKLMAKIEMFIYAVIFGLMLFVGYSVRTVLPSMDIKYSVAIFILMLWPEFMIFIWFILHEIASIKEKEEHP